MPKYLILLLIGTCCRLVCGDCEPDCGIREVFPEDSENYGNYNEFEDAVNPLKTRFGNKIKMPREDSSDTDVDVNPTEGSKLDRFIEFSMEISFDSDEPELVDSDEPELVDSDEPELVDSDEPELVAPALSSRVLKLVKQYSRLFEGSYTSDQKVESYYTLMEKLFDRSDPNGISSVISQILEDYSEANETEQFKKLDYIHVFLLKKENSHEVATPEFIETVLRPALEGQNKHLQLAATSLIKESASNSIAVKENLLNSGIFELLLNLLPITCSHSVKYDWRAVEVHLASSLLSAISAMIEDFHPAQELLLEQNSQQYIKSLFSIQPVVQETIIIPIKAITIIEELMNRPDSANFSSVNLVDQLAQEGWCSNILAFLHKAAGDMGNDRYLIWPDIPKEIMDDIILTILRPAMKLKENCIAELHNSMELLTKLEEQYNRDASSTTAKEIARDLQNLTIVGSRR